MGMLDRVLGGTNLEVFKARHPSPLPSPCDPPTPAALHSTSNTSNPARIL